MTMRTDTGICISLLGRFCVYLGEREILASSFKSRKALGLLKLLALQPKHEMHRDQALEVFWPDLDPTSAAAQLYKAIHFLRRAFETTDSHLTTERLLAYRGEVLSLIAPNGGASAIYCW